MTLATFGMRIRELRQEGDLTQREVAARVGVDASYISKMENGRLEHTPSADTVATLAEVLGADHVELLGVAGKLPRVLAFAESPAARKFLRAAGERVASEDDWEKLTLLVESEFVRPQPESAP